MGIHPLSQNSHRYPDLGLVRATTDLAPFQPIILGSSVVPYGLGNQRPDVGAPGTAGNLHILGTLRTDFPPAVSLGLVDESEAGSDPGPKSMQKISDVGHGDRTVGHGRRSSRGRVNAPVSPVRFRYSLANLILDFVIQLGAILVAVIVAVLSYTFAQFRVVTPLNQHPIFRLRVTPATRWNHVKNFQDQSHYK